MPGRRAGSPVVVLYILEYNAESPKQGRKTFNSIVKTIHFSNLPIIYLCSMVTTAPYSVVIQDLLVFLPRPQTRKRERELEVY